MICVCYTVRFSILSKNDVQHQLYCLKFWSDVCMLQRFVCLLALFILQVVNLSCRCVEEVFLSDLSTMVLCFFTISIHAWNLRIKLLPSELELLSNCVPRFIDEIHMKHWHWENLSTVIFEFWRSNSSFHWHLNIIFELLLVEYWDILI
jgi:hypothetical protein